MALGSGCLGLSGLVGLRRLGMVARKGEKATVLPDLGDGAIGGYGSGRVGGVQLSSCGVLLVLCAEHW